MVNDHDNEVSVGADHSQKFGDTRGDAPAQVGSVQLVVLAVLGGVYLFSTVGWIVGVARIVGGQPRVAADPGGVFFDVMFTIGGLLAILGPAAWIGVTLLLTRERPSRSRILWLVVGAVVLVPWFFVRGSWAGA